MPGSNEWGPSRKSWLLVVLAWTLVAIPLGWGVYRTLKTALILFR
jgi:hypothetical protein